MVNSDKVADIVHWNKCGYISFDDLPEYHMETGDVNCSIEADENDSPLYVYDGMKWKVPKYLQSLLHWKRENMIEATYMSIFVSKIEELVDRQFCEDKPGYVLVSDMTFPN